MMLVGGLFWGTMFGFLAGIKFFAEDMYEQNKIDATMYDYASTWMYIFDRLKKKSQ